jgi:hypothetical protein
LRTGGGFFECDPRGLGEAPARGGVGEGEEGWPEGLGGGVEEGTGGHADGSGRDVCLFVGDGWVMRFRTGVFSVIFDIWQ